MAAGLPAAIGNHSFRASGITAFLKAGGTVEAAAIASHASTRTTQLYDRRRELVEPDDSSESGFNRASAPRGC